MIPRLLSAVLLAWPPSAGAQVYKWTDEKGEVHYSNTRPAKTASKVKVLDGGRVSSYEASPAGAGSGLENLQPASTSQTVELFTTSWCPYCVKAKSYLRSRGISYQEYDVESDASAAARARGFGWSGGVPFALIGGKPVRGFSESTYDRLLASR
jgi:glutaredoxin